MATGRYDFLDCINMHFLDISKSIQTSGVVQVFHSLHLLLGQDLVPGEPGVAWGLALVSLQVSRVQLADLSLDAGATPPSIVVIVRLQVVSECLLENPVVLEEELVGVDVFNGSRASHERPCVVALSDLLILCSVCRFCYDLFCYRL